MTKRSVFTYHVGLAAGGGLLTLSVRRTTTITPIAEDYDVRTRLIEDRPRTVLACSPLYAAIGPTLGDLGACLGKQIGFLFPIVRSSRGTKQLIRPSSNSAGSLDGRVAD